MGFLDNIVSPLFSSIFLVVIGFFILVIFFKILKKPMTNFPYFLKYKIFRKPYDEEKVKLCYYLIENGKGEDFLTKAFLLEGKESELNDILYIYRKILKKLKGGDKK